MVDLLAGESIPFQKGFSIAAYPEPCVVALVHMMVAVRVVPTIHCSFQDRIHGTKIGHKL